jgi:predicted membrane-bound mannosyltransferase
MKTRRRSVLRRTVTEPATDVNGNGDSGDTIVNAAEAEIAHDPGANGHEHLEEAIPQVSSSHAGTHITLPKRRRRFDETRVVATPPEQDSRTVIAPRPRRGETVTTERVLTQETAEPRFTWRSLMTYENLFWAGLFALAIVTRLWDIGNRGIHHDESLHAVYSNNLYKGVGYTHDPMMHGPLQFHLVASMFWLFGATDATARLASAFCGIFVVMSPFFLRRQLGRLTALICSVLLLVSPSILYFSRMAREDAIFSGMEMLMMVGLWRFISMRRPADFYIFCAGLALMFTIKETAYLTVAVLALFFILLFAYQSGYAILGALIGYGATMGGMFLLLKSGGMAPLPNIPEVNPNYDIIVRYATGMLGHPLVQLALIITAIFAGVIIFFFRMRARQMVEAGEDLPLPARRTTSALPSRRVRPGTNGPTETSTTLSSANGRTRVSPLADTAAVESKPEAGDGAIVERDLAPNEASPLWNSGRLDPKPGTLLSRYEPGSLPYLVGSLLSRPVVLLVGFVIAAFFFTILYTVFFTDTPRGIVSGLFASIGYWMAQQGVERGGQPWFYYLLLIPLYEPIAVFFSVAAGIFFSWRGIRRVLASRAERLYEGGTRLGSFNTDRPVPFAKFDSFFPLFLGVWLLGVFVLYSWAGEKMPWLMVHMVRPAIFLASLFIGALVASLLARRRERIEEAGLLAGDTELRRPASRGPVAARGAFFSLSGAKEMVRQAGIAPRTLALDTGSGMPPSTVAFSMNGGSRSRSRSVPPPPPVPRRRSGYNTAQAVAVRVQDPPWVTWSRPESRAPIVLFLTLFTLFTMSWALSMNTLIASSKYNEWAATWMFPVLMLGLLALFVVWVGPGRALRYFALGILTVGLMYQFRSAIMLTYHQPDVPKEMAVYVQTSPDVTRVIHEIENYAYATAGSKRDLKVMYDSFTSWPMEWYLRDYNKNFIAEAKAEPTADQRILLLEYAQHNSDENLKNNYVAQRYAMRWWFPEEWYKNEFLPGMNTKTTPFGEQVGGALRTTWATISEPSLQGTLWKYLMFREPPKPLGSEDMILFVRKDAVQQYHYIQYAPPRSDNLPGPTAPPPIQP